MNYIIKHFVFIVLLSISLSATAGERYTTRLIENGTMVFFNPTEVPSLNKGYTIEYDMTFLTMSDTVGINMTLTAKENKIQSVSLHCGDATFNTTNPTIFFSDMNGKKFDTRIHLDCPKTVFEQLFTQKEPLTICVQLANNTQISFVYKNKVWQKELQIVSNILNLYK